MDSPDFRAGHRERLRQKFLAGHIADYELFELLLSYAIPRRDVRPLSRQLLKRYGSIYEVLTAPMESLIQNPGIRENTAVFFQVIHKIMLNGFKCKLTKEPVFHNEQDIFDYCKLLLAGKTVEEFHVLYLDRDLRLVADDLHSVGTIDWAAVYVREILKRALGLNARSVVLVHNHLVTQTSFSTDDIEITTDLRDILEVAGIELYDHFLVSGDLLYSARNLHLLDRMGFPEQRGPTTVNVKSVDLKQLDL
ncbi:MAG: hypothetical protein K2L94_04810 [Alphaproteobacteria bacterium]|nr:hypothetical protein [Alphaproteobacteria bacterium]